MEFLIILIQWAFFFRSQERNYLNLGTCCCYICWNTLIVKIITHYSYQFTMYLHCSVWLGKAWRVFASVIIISDYCVRLVCLLSSLPPTILFLHISNDVEYSLTTPFSLPLTPVPSTSHLAIWIVFLTIQDYLYPCWFFRIRSFDDSVS